MELPSHMHYSPPGYPHQFIFTSGMKLSERSQYCKFPSTQQKWGLISTLNFQIHEQFDTAK